MDLADGVRLLVALGADRAVDGVAEDVMVPGPVTVRADADLGETRARMQRRGVTSLLVTTPEGILLGELTASDGRRAPLQPEGPLAPH